MRFICLLLFTDDLITITDSLSLELSSSLNPGPTRFMDNSQDSNSVIDLVFLPPNNSGFSKHTLHPDIWKSFNHVPLTIEVDIKDINIDTNI